MGSDPHPVHAGDKDTHEWVSEVKERLALATLALGVGVVAGGLWVVVKHLINPKSDGADISLHQHSNIKLSRYRFNVIFSHPP